MSFLSLHEEPRRTARPIQIFATTSAPPAFGSDFATYTSNLRTRPPREDSIALFDPVSRYPSDGFTRSVLVCSTQKIMHMVGEIVPNIVPDRYHRRDLHVSMARGAKTVILVQTARNLTTISHHLGALRYAARKDPSYQKLNYVQHLQDHLQAIIQSSKLSTVEVLEDEATTFADARTASRRSEILTG